MEVIKKTENLTFTVNYSDEIKKDVEEGILFEFTGTHIDLHLGTSRAECLFAIVEATIETIEAFGLAEQFHNYLEMNRGNEPEVKLAES